MEARMPIRRAVKIAEKIMNHTANQNVAQTFLIGPGYS